MNIGEYLSTLGEAASAAGWSRVGGISATRKREGNGICSDQTRTVTEVGSHVDDNLPIISSASLL